MRFALVLFGIQYLMTDTVTLQQAGQVFRRFNRRRADENRLTFIGEAGETVGFFADPG